MTARIYTIPARDVVPGMTVALSQHDWPARFIVKVEHSAVSVLKHDIGAIVCPPTEPVSVTLPGPSPRELLCDCGPWRDADKRIVGPWQAHMEDCPVHRLRLRLWPVGATWDDIREGWYVPYHDGVVLRRPLVRQVTLRANFASYPEDDADQLRAAFCEPDLEQCPACYGKGILHTWIDDDSCEGGGYEGPEMYCPCAAGQRRSERK